MKLTIVQKDICGEKDNLVLFIESFWSRFMVISNSSF